MSCVVVRVWLDVWAGYVCCQISSSDCIVSKVLLYSRARVGVKVAATLERRNMVATVSLSHTHAYFHSPHLRNFHLIFADACRSCGVLYKNI
eukprot:00595_4